MVGWAMVRLGWLSALLIVSLASCHEAVRPAPGPTTARRASPGTGQRLPPVDLGRFSYELPMPPTRALPIPPPLPLPAAAHAVELPAGPIRRGWIRYREAEAQWAARRRSEDASVLATLSQISDALDRWLRGAPRAAGAAHYLLGGQLHVLRAFAEPEHDTASAAAHRRRAVALLGEAKSRSTAESEVGWYARYSLALVLEASQDTTRARAELEPLASLDRPGTAEVLLRLAWDEPGEARLRAALARAAPGTELHVTAWQLLVARLHLRREYAQALAAVLAGPPTRLADELPTAIDCLERLGDPERALPRSLAAPVVAAVAAGLAANARARGDLPGEARAWRLLLARAPDGEEAQRARASLASVEETLRAPARPLAGEAERRDLSARVRRLLRHCLRPEWQLRHELELGLELAPLAGESRVAPSLAPSDASVGRLIRCLETSAPAYLSGVPRGARASVRVTPAR